MLVSFLWKQPSNRQTWISTSWDIHRSYMATASLSLIFRKVSNHCPLFLSSGCWILCRHEGYQNHVEYPLANSYLQIYQQWLSIDSFHCPVYLPLIAARVFAIATFVIAHVCSEVLQLRPHLACHMKSIFKRGGPERFRA